jgi:hypothetical protein
MNAVVNADNTLVGRCVAIGTYFIVSLIIDIPAIRPLYDTHLRDQRTFNHGRSGCFVPPIALQRFCRRLLRFSGAPSKQEQPDI